MAKTLDKVLVPLSKKMLKLFGKDLQYTSKIPTETAESSSSEDDGFKRGTPFTVSAIVEDYNRTTDPAYAETLIEIGDKKVSVAAAFYTSLKPSAGDFIVIDGLEYSVIKVDAVYSGDEVALYVLQCRRG